MEGEREADGIGEVGNLPASAAVVAPTRTNDTKKSLKYMLFDLYSLIVQPE